MSTQQIRDLTNKEYAHGFVSDIESEIIAKPPAYLVAVFGVAECACTHCCHLLDSQGPALVNESLQHVQGASFCFR